MRSPFPGMDPYLEHPALWPDVHHGLIEGLRELLAPRLRPAYRVAIEKRAYLAEPEGLVFVGRPEVAVVKSPAGNPAVQPPSAIEGSATLSSISVTVPVPDLTEEAYLEVRDVRTGEVITALELLSPANKRNGEGRRAYDMKRQRVLGCLTHLVEIDLLRAGEPMPLIDVDRTTPYSVLVSRSETRPRAELIGFGVRDELPTFSLPLKGGEDSARVELQEVLASLYDRAGYDLAIAYDAEPEPPLAEDDAAWADELLRARGLR